MFKDYPRRDAKAREALLAMGEPAVRVLTRETWRPPSKWRRRIASLTSAIPLLNRLFRVSTFDRLLAVKALAEFGAAANSALPALEEVRGEDDPMLSLAATAALIRIRAEKIDSHIATYRMFETTNSAQTVFLLIELGAYAKAAVPALLEGIRSTNERVRFLAVMALPAIDQGSPEHIPLLLRSLRDPSGLVRQQGLNSLADFGPPSVIALPQVRKALQDTNALVRAAALMFFERVLSDEDFTSVRDEVAKAEQDADTTVSSVARFVLSQRPRTQSKERLGR